MSTHHDFKQKLAQAQEDELILDTHFAKHFFIIDTALDIDKKGIDRVFIDKTYFKPYTVEYKCDRRMAQTGNAFIELCSVSKNGLCQQKGWAYTCKARFLIYYDVINGIMYNLKVQDIKNSLDTWMEKYRTARSFNKNYNSVGLLVPIKELELIRLKPNDTL